MKTCKNCGSEFETLSKKRTLCRDCYNDYQNEWRKNNPGKVAGYVKCWQLKNPDKLKAATKNWRDKNPDKVKALAIKRKPKLFEQNLMRKYGLTLDQYQEMLISQENQCAICSLQSDRLDVDHNHTSGKVRKLLCGQCNKALGLLKDSPTICRAAAIYLESTQ